MRSRFLYSTSFLFLLNLGFGVASALAGDSGSWPTG